MDNNPVRIVIVNGRIPYNNPAATCNISELKKSLSAISSKVSVATSENQVIEMTCRREVDIVIFPSSLDFFMAQRLQRECPRIKVIVLTEKKVPEQPQIIPQELLGCPGAIEVLINNPA